MTDEGGGRPGHAGVPADLSPTPEPAAQPALGPGWRRAVRALTNRNFRLYWSGQVISLIGTWMQRTTQQWLVFRLTGSPLDLGVVAFATFIPFLLFSPIAGLAIDRVDRRRLILAAQVSYVVLAIVQAALVFTGLIQYWHIVVVGFLLGLVETFEFPGRMALIGAVVEREDLHNAIALHSSAFSTARIVGPALAGILLAHVGEAPAFVINALAGVPVIAGLLAMQLRPEAAVIHESLMKEMRAGVRFVLGSTRVKTLTLAVMLQGLLALPYVSLVPVFAGDVLRAGPQGLGALTAATGVGALAGAVWVLGFSGNSRRGRLMTGGMFGIAIFMAVFSMSRSMPLSMAALFALGLSQVVHQTTANTLVQLEVPDPLRGRVLSLYVWLHAGPLPIGALLMGAVAQVVGAPAAVLGGALLYAAGLLLVYWRWPGLASWD